jgi:ubiquinone/menaquinone biosynthesis C-methylase UbiE
MSIVEGASSFRGSGEAYDRFMGRYSTPLAAAFADAAGIAAGRRALDVGCGPGALTAELVRRLGAENVAAIDPSESFVDACRRRNPGVDVQVARAEDLPHADDLFDAALAQLVLHFVSDPDATAREMHRVVRSGGIVAACVWDFGGGMTMLRLFWDAALALDPSAPDEAETRRFGRVGEIAELFVGAGLRDVTNGALDVEAAYEGFDDFWTPFLTGTGPAGSYCASLDNESRLRLREDLRARLGSPPGPFTLTARAWFATGRT